MILEGTMSPNDDNPEEVKRAQKKYLWFGYGSYAPGGDASAFQPVNIRADPKILDRLLELFGVKEKREKDSDRKTE